MTLKSQIIKTLNIEELSLPLLHKFSGKVVKGFGRGQKIGFATANLQLTESLDLPLKYGVYAVLVKILDPKFSKQVFMASCNYGKALTFAANKATIEPHLINFEGDLYGKKLEVYVYKYLREMQKFASVEILQQKLTQDVSQVVDFFEQIKC